jgi:hypothetical protein
MNQTIYIQKAVWNTFEGEPNKSALVNELLRRHYGMAGGVNLITNSDGTISPRRVGPPASFQTATIPISLERACCIANKPCKHWVFDDLNTVWRNELTGKEREA